MHPDIGQFGTQVIARDGSTIATAKNLRAMLRHASKSRIVAVQAHQCPKNEYNGRVRVTYEDGAQCSAFFSSYTVLLEWLYARKSWFRMCPKSEWSVEGLALSNVNQRSVHAAERLNSKGVY